MFGNKGLNLVFLFTFLSLVSCKIELAKEAAKNIIIFIADGCGYSHITAAELYQFGEVEKAINQHFSVKVAMATFPNWQSSKNGSSKKFGGILWQKKNY